MFSYPKATRILTRKHFISLSREGKRVAGNFVSFDYRKGKSSLPRLGITVLKRHGKSHVRNRFKRVVREVFRELRPSLPQDLELNIMPRRPLEWPQKAEILQDFLLFIEKLKAEEPSIPTPPKSDE